MATPAMWWRWTSHPSARPGLREGTKFQATASRNLVFRLAVNRRFWSPQRRPHASNSSRCGQEALFRWIIATMPMRVVLADDDILLREGLASLLERSGFDVVGQAGDGAQVVALARDTAPELVVVDIRMPPTHTVEGLEAARTIRQELPDTAILVLSAHVEVEHAMELLATGR